jgi:tetratricopeptide (TPR) repeat protein
LAGIQINLGIVHKNLGDVREAETYYRKAIATLQKLAARFPAVPEHRRRLATARQNLGNLLQQTGRTAEAVAAHRGAVATYEKLAGEFPGVPAYQSDLADALYGLGNTLVAAGQVGEADAAYTRAVGLQEKLLAGEPGNPAYRAALASTCNNLAVLLAIVQGPPYPGADRAVSLARRVVGLESQFGRRWETLGWAEFRAGNWLQCLEALERARVLGGRHPADEFFRAMALWHLGEKDEARLHHDAAVRSLKNQAGRANEVLRVRAEAAALLGVTDGKDGTDTKTPPPGGGR